MKKIISGLKITTTNENNKSQAEIWEVWWNFFEKWYFDNLSKYSLNGKIFAVYTNYKWDFLSWEYDFYLWVEVEKFLEDFENIEIKLEKFQVFEFDYTKPEDTINAWEQIWWNKDLSRSYTFDLEEYDLNNWKLKIYISIN